MLAALRAPLRVTTRAPLRVPLRAPLRVPLPAPRPVPVPLPVLAPLPAPRPAPLPAPLPTPRSVPLLAPLPAPLPAPPPLSPVSPPRVRLIPTPPAALTLALYMAYVRDEVFIAPLDSIRALLRCPFFGRPACPATSTGGRGVYRQLMPQGWDDAVVGVFCGSPILCNIVPLIHKFQCPVSGGSICNTGVH